MRRKLAALCGALVLTAPVIVACDDERQPDRGPVSRPPYDVLRARDAVDAVEGDDYEVVHELTPSDGESAAAVLADGRLVALVNEQPSPLDAAAYVLFLVDLATGDRERLPDARARPVVDLRLSYEYASVGDRWVLVSPYAYDTVTGRLVRLFRRGSGADPTRELTDDVAVVPLGEADAVGAFAHWGVVRLTSAR